MTSPLDRDVQSVTVPLDKNGTTVLLALSFDAASVASPLDWDVDRMTPAIHSGRDVSAPLASAVATDSVTSRPADILLSVRLNTGVVGNNPLEGATVHTAE